METTTKSSKTAKIVYWISAGLLALFILPGIFFMNDPMALEGSGKLGVPYWLHVEAGIASFLGGLAIILPFLPRRIHEWAFFGLATVYISAMIGHLSVSGPVAMSFQPLVLLAVLVVAYISYHKAFPRK